jgi:hypothetical protein
LVDFVNISDTQLQLKNVSFIGSWAWNKLMTTIPKELSTTIDQFPPPLAFDDDIQDRWVWGASQTGMLGLDFKIINFGQGATFHVALHA